MSSIQSPVSHHVFPHFLLRACCFCLVDYLDEVTLVYCVLESGLSGFLIFSLVIPSPSIPRI